MDTVSVKSSNLERAPVTAPGKRSAIVKASMQSASFWPGVGQVIGCQVGYASGECRAKKQQAGAFPSWVPLVYFEVH